jgi:hypothetical protein
MTLAAPGISLLLLVALFFTTRIDKPAVAAGKHPRLGVAQVFR